MRIAAIVTICVFLGLFASGSFAAGGQNQTANPIFGDGCVEVTPPGIDTENCEEVPAPPQSGVEVFFCDGTRIIICEEEEGD